MYEAQFPSVILLLVCGQCGVWNGRKCMGEPFICLDRWRAREQRFIRLREQNARAVLKAKLLPSRDARREFHIIYALFIIVSSARKGFRWIFTCAHKKSLWRSALRVFVLYSPKRRWCRRWDWPPVWTGLWCSWHAACRPPRSLDALQSSPAAYREGLRKETKLN